MMQVETKPLDILEDTVADFVCFVGMDECDISSDSRFQDVFLAIKYPVIVFDYCTYYDDVRLKTHLVSFLLPGILTPLSQPPEL